MRDLDRGRGPDAVIDAVGMEAHGSPAAKAAAHARPRCCPTRVAAKLMREAGVDRLAALQHGHRPRPPRRHRLASSACTAAMTDPMPMMTMFDKQIQMRMGQANVRRWVDDILPLLVDDDPLGVDTFATHHVPLDGRPGGVRDVPEEEDGAIKVVFKPQRGAARRRPRSALRARWSRPARPGRRGRAGGRGAG